MDGSDGGPDMRMDMTPGGRSCGTFVRTLGNEGSDSELYLVMGTIEQPDQSQAKTGSDIEAFYKAANVDVEIMAGAANAALHLKTLFENAPGGGRTLALRDYYAGSVNMGVWLADTRRRFELVSAGY